MCTTSIDYTSRDFDAIYTDLVALIPTLLPEWTSTSDNDFGHVLLQLFAYVGDILNYYIDRVANESYLSTAVQRGSILNIANMLGYVPYDNIAATGGVTFTVTGAGITVPALTQVQAVINGDSDANSVTVTFETDAAVTSTGTTVTATITEGATISNEVIGTGSGLAYQEFIVQRTPIINGSLSISVGGTAWVRVDNLIQYAASDKVYETYTDSLSRVHVRFGDSVNGLAPANSTSITATYRLGGGSIGNVSAGSISQLASSVTGVVSVVNTLATTGGADAESNDHIRQTAPLALKTLNRAVTLSDFASIAITQPYCSKARASGGTWNSVTLYAAPPSGGTASVTVTDASISSGSPQLSSATAQFTQSDVGALVSVTGAGAAGVTLYSYISTVSSSTLVFLANNASTAVSGATLTILNRPVLISATNKTLLQSYVQNRAVVGATVTVADPTYVATNITASVVVLPQYKQSQVLAAVSAAVQSLLSYDAVILGDTITASDIYAAVTSVEGVDYLNVLTTLGRDFRLSNTYTTVTSAVFNSVAGITIGDKLSFISLPGTPSETTIASNVSVTSLTGNTVGFASTNITGATVARILPSDLTASFNTNEIPVPGVINLSATGGVS